jgi:hypothetical protein
MGVRLYLKRMGDGWQVPKLGRFCPAEVMSVTLDATERVDF